MNNLTSKIAKKFGISPLSSLIIASFRKLGEIIILRP